MKLLSVNVAPIKTVAGKGRSYQTGIHKTGVFGRLWLGALGLAGDEQADRAAHGGPNRAVYCYPHENYTYWRVELGLADAHYGLFGENLTLLGLRETVACIGDVYRIGGAVIQITQPRVPCYKLADKLGIPGFEKTFLAANRPGFYARVLEEGNVEAGDPVLLLEKDPLGLTVAAVNRALYLDKGERALAERALQSEALSPGWRRAFEKLLAET